MVLMDVLSKKLWADIADILKKMLIFGQKSLEAAIVFILDLW